MLSLAAIFAQSLTTRVTDRVGEMIDIAKRNAIAGAVIGILVSTAYVFGMVALSIWLSRRYGAVEAMCGLAGGFLLVALIVLAFVMIRNKREKELRRLRREKLAARRDLMAAAAAVTAKRPLAATGIALALGFLLAPKSDRD